jgi:hypothetical protein
MLQNCDITAYFEHTPGTGSENIVPLPASNYSTQIMNSPFSDARPPIMNSPFSEAGPQK